MSTRANIKVTDGYGETLWFYRHCDGYPDGAMPLIEDFMAAVSNGIIRKDASQAAGWLVVLGNAEYNVGSQPKDWKVGSIEPTTGRHGDIDYLYHLNLENCIVNIYKTSMAQLEKNDDLLESRQF